MRDLTDRALSTATTRGATYADVRVVHRIDESINIKSGRVEGAASGESEGFGIRVLVDGAWGFASSHRLEADEVDRVAAEAVRIARASATALRHRVRARPPAAGPRHATRRRSSKTPSGSRSRRRSASSWRPTRSPRRSRASPSPSRPTPPSATKRLRGQRRQLHRPDDHPCRLGHRDERDRRATSISAGAIPMPGAAGNRPATSTSAGCAWPNMPDRCPSRRSSCSARPSARRARCTIVLDPSQLYLQVHESCGHPTELDRVFGTEASYAGTSFLTTDKLDSGFRYGSDLIDIVADATAPGGLGTFGWDDEGVAAQSVPLIQYGHLRRATCPAARRRPGSGASRAARCGPTAGTGSRSSG